MPFTFECFKQYKRDLGYLDMINELNELAVRELLNQAQQFGDFGQFIVGKSTLHQVKVNPPSHPKNLTTIISRGYILGVSQAFDLFLENFKEEHGYLIGTSWGWEDKVNHLETGIKNVQRSFQYQNDVRFVVCNYYRYVRNAAAHGETSDAERYYKKIKSCAEDILREYGKIPKEYNYIDFDDFLLYSQATQDIAFLLCQIGRPTDQQIADAVNPRRYMKYKNNKDRMMRAVANEVRVKYGLTDHEVDSIVLLIDFERYGIFDKTTR